MCKESIGRCGIGDQSAGKSLHGNKAHVGLPAHWKDLYTSLDNLRTDYIDLYQFHNPGFCPKPGDGTGLYEADFYPHRTGHTVAAAPAELSQKLLSVPGNDLCQFFVHHRRLLHVRQEFIQFPLPNIAREAVESGLYETLQFPFSYLAGEKDIELVEMCRKADMGFIG